MWSNSWETCVCRYYKVKPVYWDFIIISVFSFTSSSVKPLLQIPLCVSVVSVSLPCQCADVSLPPDLFNQSGCDYADEPIPSLCLYWKTTAQSEMKWFLRFDCAPLCSCLSPLTLSLFLPRLSPALSSSRSISSGCVSALCVNDSWQIVEGHGLLPVSPVLDS